MNFKLTCLVILLTNFVCSQEVVFESDNFSNVLPETLMAGGKVSYFKCGNVFFLDFIKDDKIGMCLFDNTYNIKQQALLFKKHPNFLNFIKSYGTEKKHILIFSKDSRKKFYAIKYDIESRIHEQKILDFKLDREKPLGVFTHEDKFYVLSFLKEISLFRLRILDTNLNFETKDIDIKKGTFSYENQSRSFPKDETYISKTILNFKDYNFPTISQNEETSIETIIEPNKLYVFDNTLVITLDSNENYNSLIKLDLHDFSSSVSQILKEYFLPEENEKAKTNSFIFNDKLFLLKGTNEKISVNALDLKTNAYIFKRTFENTNPFYEEKNLMVSEDIDKQLNLPIPKNKKIKNGVLDFLKHQNFNTHLNPFKLGTDKVKNTRQMFNILMGFSQNTGLKFYEKNDSFLITIGSNIISSFASGPNGTNVVSSETFHSFCFYLNKKDFSLMLGDYLDPYQTIEKFIEEQKIKKIIWRSKFKTGNDYILGYYNKNDKKYYLRKFNQHE